jgi:predicted aldo/keto reductase-like oxidoreductase
MSGRSARRHSDNAPSSAPLPQRDYGTSGDRISVVGFGGIMIKKMPQPRADDLVAEAVRRGVTYFDVAPGYGDAEERLGPALAPVRDEVFLACKTLQRTADDARAELERSLKRLRTQRFDLYQLHAVTSLDDVERVFAPGGAMEFFREAHEAGVIRHIGFSSHSDAAAVAMLDRFDFDSVLFPINFACWLKHGFGKRTYEACRRRGTTLLGLKSLAHHCRPKDETDNPFPNCWYRPLTDNTLIPLALRFTLSRATAAVSPGDARLLRRALAAAPDCDTPLSPEEEALLRDIAEKADPIFGA